MPSHIHTHASVCSRYGARCCALPGGNYSSLGVPGKQGVAGEGVWVFEKKNGWGSFQMSGHCNRFSTAHLIITTPEWPLASTQQPLQAQNNAAAVSHKSNCSTLPLNSTPSTKLLRRAAVAVTRRISFFRLHCIYALNQTTDLPHTQWL